MVQNESGGGIISTWKEQVRKCLKENAGGEKVLFTVAWRKPFNGRSEIHGKGKPQGGIRGSLAKKKPDSTNPLRIEGTGGRGPSRTGSLTKGGGVPGYGGLERANRTRKQQLIMGHRARERLRRRKWYKCGGGQTSGNGR